MKEKGLKVSFDFNEIFEVQNLTSSIKRILKINDKKLISFNELNLRPNFGSQLSDKGYLFDGINNYPILEVKKIKGEIFCEISDDKFHSKVGEILVIKQDYTRRKNISKMHSAIHLLCSLNKDEMIRGYAGDKKSKVEFKGSFKNFERNFPEIKNSFYHYIENDNIIKKYYLNLEDAKKLRNLKEFSEKQEGLIRIIEIQNFDPRVCLGTHVKSTKCLNDIKILEPKKIDENSYKLNLELKNY